MTPKVTVITTVYNCEKYISKSIDSILNQTFNDFEYIIVNDGSTDNTTGIINSLAGKDKRLVLINNKLNQGRVKSLNIALEKSKGKFIAIQDADDISLPGRLESQYEFIDTHPEYVLVGSNITLIDENENIISAPRRPLNDSDLKFSLLFRCTFANPSIMYRRETIEKNNIRYENNFAHAEDFRFISLISRHGKVANLKNAYIQYRKHPENNSFVNEDILSNSSSLIVMENLLNLGFNINFEQATRLRKIFSSRGISRENIHGDIEIIFQIIKKFSVNNETSNNKEIARSLKRMLNWLGKKNVMTNSQYSKLFISILTYYLKQFIFKRNF